MSTTATPTPTSDLVCGEWLIDDQGSPTHVYPVAGWGRPWSGGAVPIVTRETLDRMIADFAKIPNLDHWEMIGSDLRVESTDPAGWVYSIAPDESGNYELELGYTFWKVEAHHRVAQASRNYLTGC